MPGASVRGNEMSTTEGDRRTGADDRRFGALADETRRRIVRILGERTGPVSEEELAERLAAMDSESNSEGTASDGVESLRIRLYHVHLPKLSDSGFVDWDIEERAAAATDRPISAAREPEEPIPTAGRGSAAPALADDRRREIVAVVEAGDGPVALDDLARELASTGAYGRPAPRLVEDLRIRLHHQYLPKLAAAGLVEYDLDDATVVST